ncbi:CRISPR-associated protein Cas4 [Ureibacillus thermophilus]|uniref:CRISPR-associated exonuclease Cas4 n=1 Tax=Ureibacillus thermophilus TaxID=367743 RepID=A0A4P6URZ3_9BACL|nr:CRISPR-associated protein Cas4 [Ureibacillus thermophilus]QBK25794.1 CRISPR-associated protein Cas4 [Ureibacillus thermophilus]
MFTTENNESDYLMLSGIQHFQFCQRQWALIHIEQQWEENLKTIEGQYIHKKANQPFLREKRGNKLIVRALPICSHELKISGICDVVEFVRHPSGITLQGEVGTFIPIPIEYKRGRPKKGKEDVVQLVAQAMCLEEMLACDIKEAYIYYHEIKHRVSIEITEELREEVRKMIKLMHQYYENRYTPKVKTGKFCESCSLNNICLPESLNREPVRKYMERFLE